MNEEKQKKIINRLWEQTAFRLSEEELRITEIEKKNTENYVLKSITNSNGKKYINPLLMDFKYFIITYENRQHDYQLFLSLLSIYLSIYN